jgi:hypothetical protein
MEVVMYPSRTLLEGLRVQALNTILGKKEMFCSPGLHEK